MSAPQESITSSRNTSSSRGIAFVIIGFLSVVIISLLLIGGFIWFRGNAMKSCEYAGDSYAHTESFDSTDGCNLCSCTNGEINCTDIACYDSSDDDDEDEEDVDEVSVDEGDSEDISVDEDDEDLSDEEDELPTIDLYYYKELEPQHDYEDIDKVTRHTDVENQISYVILSLINGPDADELSDGYIKAFSLSGSSTCGGNFFQYKRLGNTLKVMICKEIAPVLDAEDGYPGISLNAHKRIIYSFQKSLEINEITCVELYRSDGACFSPDCGVNECDDSDTY